MGDACGDEVGFDRVEGEREGEFADVGFDGDFPEGDNADKDGRGSFDLSAGNGWESRIVFKEPDEGVGIEKIGHGYM